MAYNNDKYNNNLNLYSQEVIDLFYPIGRGFIDFTDTDYSNYLGCTWERELVGMTAIGLDINQTDFNTIGKTGGEKTHKLTITEIPSHSHDAQLHSGGTTAAPIAGFANTANANGNGIVSGGSMFGIRNTGGNQPHNNLQPYKVVAYWKRVS